MNTESTALTVVERAAVALGAAEHEKKLIELAKESVEIVAITNPAGYQQLHTARMKLKNERVSLEKIGKAARDDASKFAKAVIVEEQRLIGIIEPEEKRLQAIQDEHDSRVERERQAKIEAERLRVERIQAAIQDIKDSGASFTVLAGSTVIGVHLEDVKAIAIDETFAEFKDEAERTKVAAVRYLTDLHKSALEHEEEQRKMRAEREELAQLRAAEEQRIREAAAREADEIRKRAEEDAARRAAIEQQEREARLKREADDRKAQEARDEQDRLAQLALDVEIRKAREQQERAQMAISEIQGIQQQVIIAQIGRAGVRAGGTIECIEETLAETEAWPISGEHFGTFTGRAQDAKNKAVDAIRELLAAAKQRAEQAERNRIESERLADLQRREEAERIEAESKARAQREADEAAQREEQRKADELLDARAMPTTFLERYGKLTEFDVVSVVIDSFLNGKKSAMKRTRALATSQ